MDSQQQLRQRGAKNAAAATPADLSHHSHSHSDEDDDAHLFEAAHADAEPLVPAARSAFDDTERDTGSESSASSAPSAAAAPAHLPAGPAAQSMDDDGSSDTGVLELDTSAAMGAIPASSGANNGSRLNLPPQLRAAFEQRRAELLAQHPDIMVSSADDCRADADLHKELPQLGDLHERADSKLTHRLHLCVCIVLHCAVIAAAAAAADCFQTRELSGEIAERGSDSLWSLCPRFDVIIMAVLLGLLCWVLQSEYNIDLVGWFGRLLRSMLDPGPVQRAQAAADVEPPEGDFAQGRAAMAAAVKAVREGLARQGQQ